MTIAYARLLPTRGRCLSATFVRKRLHSTVVLPQPAYCSRKRVEVTRAEKGREKQREVGRRDGAALNIVQKPEDCEPCIWWSPIWKLDRQSDSLPATGIAPDGPSAAPPLSRTTVFWHSLMDEEESPNGNGSDLESGFLKEDHGKSQVGPESMDINSPTKGSLDSDLNIGNLEKFCKEAARAFFKEWGLINHQISSYNDFVEHGIQDLFDTLGEVVVEPGYDPSKKGDGAWRHATITFGKVRLEKPEFWPEKNDIEEGSLKLIYVKLVEAPKAEGFHGGKVISVYFLYATMPIWIMFFALGASSDKEVLEMIDLKDCDAGMINIILATIKDADEQFEGFRSLDKAREHVNALIKNAKFPPSESFDEYVAKYLFPNIIGHRTKARFLGYMVKCLLLSSFGKRKCDNKDDFRNKRLDLAGELLARELRAHIRHAEKRMVRAIQRDLSGDRDLQPIERYLDASIITNGLNRAFSTAVTAVVSSKIMEPILDKLISCGMEKLDEISLSSLSQTHKVFLNGDWVGVCPDMSSFADRLRSMRRAKLIHPQVEIKKDKHQKEVRIFTDAGRILRPLLIVENLKKIRNLKGGVCSFQSLMDQEIIELIGVEEEEDCQSAWGIKYLLAVNEGISAPNYSHCELDPSFLLGLSCGIIPFASHNFARRVLYQSEKHSQQAIGFSTTNPSIRVDTLSHHLYYPQRPLFRTVIADCLVRADYSLGRRDSMTRPEYFNGQNAIVAVNVHQGYNQEDSLVMNRTSLERGMFRTEHFRSYKADVDNKELTKRIKLKDKVAFGKIESKKGRVDSLDDDGFPYIGASLQSGDIVIGKVAESGDDHSIKLKHTEKGMVQKVVLSANDEGKNFAVVTLRQVRSPCLGDKFSSMHGQKGVIGFLETQENFPFTHQGIVPDIVINPHAFPTRQTPGQLLEAALGKGIACEGSKRYATPFSTASVDDITAQLHRWGSERVLNGRTGEMMRSMIFMGPTFYQRLIHMAEDKVKFRNTGPVHPLTRQPVADRKRFGGVKFGEMERDCLLAHGAAANLHERLFMLSDFFQMHICQKCQRAVNVILRPVPGGKKIRGPYCGFCQSGENIVRINVPYGAKLLYQELFSMGICLKFETEVC
ncbi:hypothetical protein B296_00020515 [Ensete ventricosum]|uniref:DNA-directed RNA polymerase subunit beta n=1 Tax=Ensete ventricosum TaxID=4639 RepID=A0A427AW13_ENSVE|nr:hypothetical protein B296_00020515 [Ensete ventricosum]